MQERIQFWKGWDYWWWDSSVIVFSWFWQTKYVILKLTIWKLI